MAESFEWFFYYSTDGTEQIGLFIGLYIDFCTATGWVHRIPIKYNIDLNYDEYRVGIPASVEVTGRHPVHGNRVVFACLDPSISRPQLEREIGWANHHPHIKRGSPKARLDVVPMPIFQLFVHAIG